MMKTKKTIKKPDFVFKRRVTHIIAAIIFFAVPFIRINGLPLLRFDISNLTIYFFGQTVSPEYIFPFLLALLSFLFFFIYFTQIFGRIWCGWLCPQTVFLESLRAISVPPENKKRVLYHIKQTVAALLVALLFTAGLILYTASPSDFIHTLVRGEIHFLWWILASILFLDIVLMGRKFCTTVCPYSMFQSVMFDADTLRVGLIPERAAGCVKCNACVRTCPAGIDIREGLSNKCVSCASCVDACGKVMQNLGKTTLVGYFFGRGVFRPFHINKVITLGIAVVFLFAAVISYQKADGLSVSIANVTKVVQEDVVIYDATLTVTNKYDDPVFLKFTMDTEDLASYNIDSKEKKEIVLKFTSESRIRPLVDIYIIHGKGESKKQLEIK